MSAETSQARSDAPRHAPGLERTPMPGGFGADRLLRKAPPPKAVQTPVRDAFNGVGNQAPEDGDELEPVPAVAGRDGQARAIRVSRDPEVLVGRVTV